MPATDRLHGTLDALVLKALSLEPRHGFGILRWIADRTEDVVRVEEGSLYPALNRMLLKGWLRARWGTSDTNRRVRFYELTRDGRKQLTAETADFDKIIAAIQLVMKNA